MSVALDDHERAMLAGEDGAGAALAMRLVLLAADALQAERLIPISRAHVDSCLHHGQASQDFVDRLLAGGATVRVPTTLNVGTLDLLHPELWRGSAEAAARGRRLMESYEALGCRPTFTCAPYQLPDARPARGEQVAWAESNAIVFCNSVLGARTERYGDFTDIACAITGRVPDAGLHRDAARHATVVLRLAADVPAELREDDGLYPVLGIVLGRTAAAQVTVVDGLLRVSEDRLKAICAAAASSGSVAMFHVVGSTPEAPTLDAALGGRTPQREVEITLDELRAARDALSAGSGAALGDAIGAVSLGTPHASAAELAAIAAELEGDRVAPGVELLVSTSRGVMEMEAAGEPISRLREAGAEILVDTCSYLGPILRPTPLPTMTDSGKWAYYAPGNIGARVVFGSRRECIRSAVTGRLWRDAAVWGSH
ncbi:MAG TPA: aconitase X catalytic domain-containing protein [Candidatus Limnocylindria bacterium]|nr:aconitase X catalytic domain-containing protein [Candidatus Limnocylindria bacterium]